MLYLLFVNLEGKGGVSYGEICEIDTPLGERRRGQVLEISDDLAVIQVFEGTTGLDTDKTTVRFLGSTLEMTKFANSDILNSEGLPKFIGST